MSTPTDHENSCLRLDKWLWAVRFFKTRRLAVKAIDGGKVQVDGHRSKSGRTVRAGTRIIVYKGSLQWGLVVRAVSRQAGRPPRPPYSTWKTKITGYAARPWCGSGGSLVPPGRKLRGRPNKRERRLIQRFTRQTAD